MTELADSSEDLDEITPLRVSANQVWRENVSNNQIGGQKDGVSPDIMAEIGFKPPVELGGAALQGDVLSAKEARNELGVVEPSIDTINKWSDRAEVISASDGSRWLCAIDEDGNRFAVVPATSQVGNDMLVLHKHIDNIHSDLYDKQA